MDIEFWQNGRNHICGGNIIDDYELKEISTIIMGGDLPSVFIRKAKIKMDKKFVFFFDEIGLGFGYMEAKIPNGLIDKALFELIIAKNFDDVLKTVKKHNLVAPEILKAVAEKKILFLDIKHDTIKHKKIML